MSKETYMTKNINVFLVLMLLLVIIALAALPVFYKQSFKQVSEKYYQKKQQLDNATLLLANATASSRYYQALYENVSTEFRATQKDLAQYDTIYTQTETELESTKTELGSQIDDLSADLATTRGKLKTTSDELTALRVSHSTLQADYDEALDTIGEQDDDIVYLEDTVDALCSESGSSHAACN